MTMEVLADWVSRISNVVWNGLLLYLLVGTGIVFTIRTRFVQVRKFGAGWKHLFGHFSLNGEKAGKDGMRWRTVTVVQPPAPCAPRGRGRPRAFVKSRMVSPRAVNHRHLIKRGGKLTIVNLAPAQAVTV